MASACPCVLLSSQVIFPPGAGGLPTMKMGFVYQAAYPRRIGASGSLQYADNNFPGHAGWKEIVAVAARGQSHQQLGAADRPQRRADQLSRPTCSTARRRICPQPFNSAIRLRSIQLQRRPGAR